MHRLAAVEYAALRATHEPHNPATERRPSETDALKSHKSPSVRILTLDGHSWHSSHPMLTASLQQSIWHVRTRSTASAPHKQPARVP